MKLREKRGNVMPVKRIGVLIAALMLVLSSVCAAENMEFVDADGSTGYYVDTDSVNFYDDKLVDARIAVVKANKNRRFVYAVQFDREKGTYQIFASMVQIYDTKDVIDSRTESGPPLPYSYNSPMREIVDYIFALPH